MVSCPRFETLLKTALVYVCWSKWKNAIAYSEIHLKWQSITSNFLSRYLEPEQNGPLGPIVINLQKLATTYSYFCFPVYIETPTPHSGHLYFMWRCQLLDIHMVAHVLDPQLSKLWDLTQDSRSTHQYVEQVRDLTFIFATVSKIIGRCRKVQESLGLQCSKFTDHSLVNARVFLHSLGYIYNCYNLF